MVNSYYKKKKYDEAIEYFKQSLEVLDSNEVNHQKFISNYQNIAFSYEKLNQIEKAKPYLNEALKLAKQYFPNTVRLVTAQNNHAIWLQKMGRYDEGLQMIQENLIINAADFSDNDLITNPSSKDIFLNKNELFSSLLIKAALFANKMEQSEDVHYGKTALTIIELADTILSQLRLRFNFEENKFELLEEHIEFYPLAVKICYELFQVTNEKSFLEKAFIYMEKSKSFLLYEEINLKEILLKQGVSKEDIRKYKSHQKDIISNQRQIRNLKGDAENQGNIKRLMADTDLKNIWIEDFNRRYIRDTDLFHSQIPSLNKIQSKVDNDEIILNYTTFDSSLYCFLISKNDFVIQVFDINEALKDLIKNYRKVASKSTSEITPKKFSEVSYRLYQRLLFPIEQHLIDKKKITIIPNKLLNRISFDALVSKQSSSPKLFNHLHYLIDDFDVRYHYSASLWAATKRQAIDFDYKYIGLAPFTNNISKFTIGDFEFSLDALPNTKMEVEGGKTIFDTQKTIIAVDNDTYIGHPLTGNLEADIIHFGTHSIFHRDNVYHLVRDKEGKLISFTKDDLYRNPYLHCNLLIFNSCQSGEGKYIEGEGVMSIVRPALHQDISNILVTLNPVPDNSSSELILNFLKYISEGHNYSVSINKAKRDIKNKGLFPATWASYIFIGTD